MKSGEVLQVKTIAQYYAACGLGKPKHPLMGIYQFGEMPMPSIQRPVRFTLGFYVITIKYNCTCKSLYGQTSYDYDEGVMGFTAPNQVLGLDKEFTAPDSGWCLLVHPDLLLYHDLARKIKNYHFFHYEVDEALILSEAEEQDVEGLFQKIKQELDRPIDNFSQDVLIAQLDLLLTYSNRFYNRQFLTRKPLNHHLLSKFEVLLEDRFSGETITDGLPTVSYFADKLSLSSKYLSDMLKQLTGLTAQQHIHEKLIEKAKEKLSITQLSISEIAYELGFEHSQSFSKLFKAKTKQSPVEFRQSMN
ncbi:helix-turn-helix domain-containing protein [Spirosoma harenae]